MFDAAIDSRHILVVDRDMIVGMSTAQDFEELGFRVSGPFVHADEAFPVLSDDCPDLAVIDVDLRDGTGLPLARALRAHGVPFVCFSADRSRKAAFGEIGPIPWVDKPATTADLLVAFGDTPVP